MDDLLISHDSLSLSLSHKQMLFKVEIDVYNVLFPPLHI